MRPGGRSSTTSRSGYVVYAPEAFVPGAAAFPTAPVSPDAVLMTTAYVEPAHRGGGTGPDAGAGHGPRPGRARDIRAVEAFGDTRGRRASCVVPIDFLGSVGFKTQRAHGTSPRMRMDLRTTVTWRSEVEAALERLRRRRAPAARATEAAPRGRLR